MPASYPTSVKTFAARSNGAVIDASHVQDLQDEVTAIESGLLNGTAPLNSSNSTMVNLTVTSSATLNILKVSGASSLGGTLHVTGNSTIAGSLNVSGNSTFTGTVNFTGTVTGISQTGPVALLTHSAKTEVAAATWVALNWDTETLDTDGMHSTSANSSRIVFAGSTGTYQVAAIVQWSQTASSGLRSIQVFKNDTTVVRTFSYGMFKYDGASTVTMQTVSAALQATSTADYITIRVRHDSVDASSASITAVSASGVPAVDVYRVRA